MSLKKSTSFSVTSSQSSSSWIDIQRPLTTSDICISAYWQEYPERQDVKPMRLDTISPLIKNICIAFIAPARINPTDDKCTTWKFDTEDNFTKNEIKTMINTINNNGYNQNIYFSLLDTPTEHWYPDVNIDQFAKNIAQTCIDWGLAGIDIDAESGMDSGKYVETFTQLIKGIKKYAPNKKILYTCYTESEYDTEIIKNCKTEIDMIQTMAYWDDFNSMQSLFNHYSNQIGDPNKVSIGVKAGNESSDYSATKLDVVKQIAIWSKQEKHPNMMLWTVNRDIKQETNKDNGIYLKTIIDNITDINIPINPTDNNTCIIL